MRYNIVDITPAIRLVNLAPRGHHRTTFAKWAFNTADRQRYNYTYPSDQMLAAMRSHAEAEVMGHFGKARDAAKVWTGLNAIEREIENRE